MMRRATFPNTRDAGQSPALRGLPNTGSAGLCPAIPDMQVLP
jgi:hypothetical protein